MVSMRQDCRACTLEMEISESSCCVKSMHMRIHFLHTTQPHHALKITHRTPKKNTGMSSSPPSLSSSPSHSTAVEAQTAATSTVAAAESKCPFTSLLSKFLPISLTAAIADIMPTTIATRHAMDSNISGGGCPLGYGRAPTLTQTGEGRGKEGRGGSSTCPLGFGSRNYPEATTTTDPSYSSLPKMSLATLQAHAHLNLLSIKGIVYDVSAQAQVHRVKVPG